LRYYQKSVGASGAQPAINQIMKTPGTDRIARILKPVEGAVAALGLLTLGVGSARASVAYGTINNFDTVNDTGVVGNFIGSQMSAFDNELPVGLIDHLLDGAIDVFYATRAMVIAVVPFTATATGVLPAGLIFNEGTGLSGAPTVSGIFTFNVRLMATNNPVLTKTYTFAIAAAGEELPPHSTVDTTVSPLGSGTTTGGGFYTNNTTATVTATPGAGFAFANWTDNRVNISSLVGNRFFRLIRP